MWARAKPPAAGGGRRKVQGVVPQAREFMHQANMFRRDSATHGPSVTQPRNETLALKTGQRVAFSKKPGHVEYTPNKDVHVPVDVCSGSLARNKDDPAFQDAAKKKAVSSAAGGPP